MSTYTTQVRWIVEKAANDPSLPISTQIKKALPSIFNFSFPIWKESYRTVLEEKIIKHYFNKEIGLETVGLWKFYLETRLNEIMPYYNLLYATLDKDYDYLTDIDYTETMEKKKSGEESADYSGKNTDDLTSNFSQSTEESTENEQNTVTDRESTSASKTDVNGVMKQNVLESDTPQANYANLDYATKLSDTSQTTESNTGSSVDENGTETTKNTGSTSVKTSNSGTQTSGREGTVKSTNSIERGETENYTIKRTGNSGRLSYPELIMEYRKSLLNIDMMIINDLSDLFMRIY